MKRLRFVFTVLSVSFIGQITQGYVSAGDELIVEDCHAVDCTCNAYGSGHLAACAAAGGCYHNTCNMPQHHRYFPQSHGYYYFRPYNHHTIRLHQNAVTRYGGDPRNPYSNKIFDDIYAEFAKVDAAGEHLPSPPNPPEATPASPFEDDAASPFESDAASNGPAASLLRFSSRRRFKKLETNLAP